MSKTVTLRLEDHIYQQFRTMAKNDNRSLSNFIETAALCFIKNEQFANDYEMDEIYENKNLNSSLKRGLHDAKIRRGRFV